MVKHTPPLPTTLGARRDGIVLQRSLEIQIVFPKHLLLRGRTVRVTEMIVMRGGRVLAPGSHPAFLAGDVPETPRTCALAIRRVGREAADAADLEGAQAVEGGLEVVEDDGVGQALEDEGELPEGVEALGETGVVEGAGDGADVADEEADGQDHGAEHDREARRDAQDLQELEVVAVLDVPEEGDGREDPPGVAVASEQ